MDNHINPQLALIKQIINTPEAKELIASVAASLAKEFFNEFNKIKKQNKVECKKPQCATGEEVEARVLSVVNSHEWVTGGVIINRNRKFDRNDVVLACNKLVEAGVLQTKSSTSKNNRVTHYFKSKTPTVKKLDVFQQAACNAMFDHKTDGGEITLSKV